MGDEFLDGDYVALIDHGMEYARFGSFKLVGDFLRGDLGQGLALLNGGAGTPVPFGKSSLGHDHPELWHSDGSRHRQAYSFSPLAVFEAVSSDGMREAVIKLPIPQLRPG